jgi:hypothetical protein
MSEIAKPTLIDAPPPGIYYDIPSSTYFAWDAVNASFLKKMASGCAAKARYEADHPKPPTDAMIQGSVCHTQLFEPDNIATRYVIAGTCCAVKKTDGAGCTHPGVILSGGGWYCGVHGKGRSWDDIPKASVEDGGEVPAIVTPEMIQKARDMAVRARWDHKIRELLFDARFEVCIVWIDPVTEVLCKARLDIYRPDTYQIGDLKTTDDASEEGFSRTIGDLGYDIQAAMYLDAATSLDGVIHEDFIFIAQENVQPYVAGACRLNQEAIALGRHRYRQQLANVKWCRENNQWPGYHDHQIIPINVTKFFFDKESRK